MQPTNRISPSVIGGFSFVDFINIAMEMHKTKEISRVCAKNELPIYHEYTVMAVTTIHSTVVFFPRY